MQWVYCTAIFLHYIIMSNFLEIDFVIKIHTKRSRRFEVETSRLFSVYFYHKIHYIILIYIHAFVRFYPSLKGCSLVVESLGFILFYLFILSQSTCILILRSIILMNPPFLLAKRVVHNWIGWWKRKTNALWTWLNYKIVCRSICI